MNVDALVARARDEIASRRTFATEMSVPAAAPASPPAWPALEMARASEPEPRIDATHADHLMSLTGSAFVMHAYRAVLGREVDPQALHHYLSMLLDGRCTRAEVLLELADSAEGRARAALHGLAALREARERSTGWRGVLAFLRRGPQLLREMERREHEIAERERRMALVVDSVAAAVATVQARLAEEAAAVRGLVHAVDDSKAPRQASLHLAMHLAALQTRVAELQEAAAAR